MIHSHDYKPDPVFRRGRKDKSRSERRNLFLGFELEVELDGDPCDACCKTDCHGCKRMNSDTPEGIAKMLLQRLRDPKGPLFYFKHDGSIDCGFEMVSHPMTYGWIRSHRPLVKRALRLLRWKNAVAGWNCGLHVHVSRAALSRRTMDRMVDFVYDNPRFIERLSRRDGDALYEWAAPDLSDFDADCEECEECEGDCDECQGNSPLRTDERNVRVAKSAIKRGRLDSRCVALNTLPTSTLEFRLFASTLDDGELFQALEFAHAVPTFCGKRLPLTVRRFADWVLTHRGTYPNLAALFASKEAGKWPGMGKTDAEIAIASAKRRRKAA